MANVAKTPEVTPEQRRAVLDAADLNLKTVIDQVNSVDSGIEDTKLQHLQELLAAAMRELDNQRGA